MSFIIKFLKRAPYPIFSRSTPLYTADHRRTLNVVVLSNGGSQFPLTLFAAQSPPSFLKATQLDRHLVDDLTAGLNADIKVIAIGTYWRRPLLSQPPPASWLRPCARQACCEATVKSSHTPHNYSEQPQASPPSSEAKQKFPVPRRFSFTSVPASLGHLARSTSFDSVGKWAISNDGGSR